MILPFLLLFLNIVHADPTWKWSKAIKIVDKHEFYKNNEIILRPKGTWQTLFGVLYHDSNLATFKDCVFYQVPGTEAGILKIKTVLETEKCEDAIFKTGDQEWRNLKALQYSLQENLLTISLTTAQFQIERWSVPLFNTFEHPKPKALMSSAEYRSSKILYLSPYKGVFKIVPQRAQPLANKTQCHLIGEDCKELSPSTCGQCAEGWYEIPNGCTHGPKYCGPNECGYKNQPACRRGLKYQKIDSEYSCRENHSFAYCVTGLSIHCQGNLPYCF